MASEDYIEDRAIRKASDSSVLLDISDAIKRIHLEPGETLTAIATPNSGTNAEVTISMDIIEPF